MNIFNPISEIYLKYFEIKTINFKVSEHWGAQNKGHRIHIRQAFLQEIKKLNTIDSTTIDRDKFLDLKKIPIMNDYYISISHCPSLGGYVHGSQPVGFDIEQESRVNTHIIDRVCCRNELRLTESSPLLWVAKESAYKALYTIEQPPTLSYVEILKWHKVKKNLYSFQAKSSSIGGLRRPIKGLTWVYENLFLGISVI